MHRVAGGSTLRTAFVTAALAVAMSAITAGQNPDAAAVIDGISRYVEE
jgi:hypothetical protein